MSTPLIEKYRIKTLQDLKGQSQAISELTTFLKAFPRKKAIILNGPVGVGKTSLAIAAANDFNLEMFELNASDLRNKSSLDEVLGPASNQQSLFKKSKLILMDEADGITTSDRGGLPELIALIDKSSFPIIITANDIWQNKFSLLRRKCQIINLKELKEEIILEILNGILLKENIAVDKEKIATIAKKSRGDVRAALNDLQILLTIEDSIPEEESDREKEETIFEALKKVFQYPTDQKIVNVYDSVDLELDEISLWLDENIPLEYQGKALAKAYDYLSKGDLFKGRIYRQQHWRFLTYQNFFLSAGISSVTKIKYRKFTQYQKPSRILKIWLANQKYQKKKSIIGKYAEFSHMSKKKAMKEYSFLPLILDSASKESLDLDESEQKYLEEKKSAMIVAGGLNKFRN